MKGKTENQKLEVIHPKSGSWGEAHAGPEISSHSEMSRPVEDG